jgi:hypothetical protein
MKTLQGTDQLFLNAVEKIYFNDFEVDGSKGTGANKNAKILFDCAELVVKNSVIKDGCTAYNVFEQKGTVKYPLSKIKCENLTCDDIMLTHNAFSTYNFADNATITIQDSTFNLDVNNSNVIRLANYTNAENVTVHFKNVNWNYEESPANADWSWAGLIIFQPAGADEALTGNLDKLKTWKFIFESCKYNGKKVTANNFGNHNQVFYLYNINKTGEITDPVDAGLNIEFK